MTSHAYDKNSDMISIPYREAVGSLISFMIGSRPDIFFSVSNVSSIWRNYQSNT